LRRITVLAALVLTAGAARGATYELDAAHSSAGFTVTHLTVSKVRGVFHSLSGTAEVDEETLAGSSIAVTIDAASIDTDVERRDEHLRSADFLDVESHPEITFQSKSMETVADTEYRVTGDLTIRGTTREVTFPVTVLGPIADPMGGGRRIGVEGRLTIDRQEFGVAWSRLLDGGGLVVGDDVHIELAAELVSAAAPE
jgi:polyisoprenoid-binding protein YceI